MQVKVCISGFWFRFLSCKGEEMNHLVLEHSVKCLDNPRRVPPFGRFDCIGNGCHLTTSLCLDLAHGPESACRESFLQLTIMEIRKSSISRAEKSNVRWHTVIWVVVRLESSKQPLPILLSLLLGRDDARRRGRAAQIVDIPISRNTPNPQHERIEERIRLTSQSHKLPVEIARCTWPQSLDPISMDRDRRCRS
jgi:hypothetical protein